MDLGIVALFSICVRPKEKSQGLQPLACAVHIDGAQTGFLQRRSHLRHLQIGSKASSSHLKSYFGVVFSIFDQVKKFGTTSLNYEYKTLSRNHWGTPPPRKKN